jgi:hypothetical protein
MLLQKIVIFCLVGYSQAFCPSVLARSKCSALNSYSPADDVGPSDYDSDTLLDPLVKNLCVDTNEEDESIREELKRELLLLSSVSDRGLFLSKEEKDIVVDIVTQLEALNPTGNPAKKCYGEWDLVLTSTQAFRSSPFFQAIRTVLGDKNSADNAFMLHEAATSIGKVGRVRQLISKDGSFISEVDLKVGVMPGMPVSVSGTVVTKAIFEVVGSQQWDVSIQSTQVKKSNIPFLDQLLEDYPLELPVGDVYDRVRGSVPVATLKTFYVDDSLRITRDVDDNFFVYSAV